MEDLVGGLASAFVGAALAITANRNLELRRERRALRDLRRKAWADWLSAAKLASSNARSVCIWRIRAQRTDLSTEMLARTQARLETELDSRNRTLDDYVAKQYGLLLLVEPDEHTNAVLDFNDRLFAALDDKNLERARDSLHAAEDSLSVLLKRLIQSGMLSEPEPRE